MPWGGEFAGFNGRALIPKKRENEKSRDFANWNVLVEETNLTLLVLYHRGEGRLGCVEVPRRTNMISQN